MTYKPLRSRSHSIELLWPFEFAGTEYKVLTLRRPNGDDLDSLAGLSGKAAAAASRKMLAGLAEIPPEVVGFLDPEDMGQIQAWLEPILDPNGEPSGSGGS